MKPKRVNRRSFLKSAAMTAGAAAIAAGTSTTKTTAAPGGLPREETLYINGHQFSAVYGWNPYSNNNNNALCISQGDNARAIVFETPYMYNMLDGQVYPLLADGPYQWNAQTTEITFKIKDAAHWSDGTPVTADDVAYTWETTVKYWTDYYNSYVGYIDSITAVDAKTVKVAASLNDGGKAINPLIVAGYLSSAYVVQKAWTQRLEERNGYNADAIKSDPAVDVIASGPYKKYLSNDQIAAVIRDNNYWGKDAAMWGKLPAPKYLAELICPDNDTALQAFKAGDGDVSHLFISNVHELWQKEGRRISTYMPDPPYNICASLPTAYFNLNNVTLQQLVIRKAIALAVDYDAIVANAMTNQSPTFTQVPRSIMNPTPGEQALLDHDAIKDLQWAGKDVEGAKKLLDEAGIKDTDGDGWREYQGKKLSYRIACPNGWFDWQAAAELVASAGKMIGVEITTLYPDWSVYQNVFTDANQTEYDIFIVWSNGSGPANPWGRLRQLMSSEWHGTQGNWGGNWGGYVNPAVDAIIQRIPTELDDPAALKNDYTAATIIYLTDIPSFTLMYRPQDFYTVSEYTWTNFPKAGDGTNIPPLGLTDGYGVAGLYHLRSFRSEKSFFPLIGR